MDAQCSDKIHGLDHDRCYQALLSRDARFDGRLFVGVRSTGIYCRPVCKVKPPLQRNCSFFSNAAQCEQLGFRPCLRCRPELSPGDFASNGASRLAYAAAAALQFPQKEVPSIERLALRLGITSRHLRRLFLAEFGVSPIEYGQTQRLLLAKRLLTDTSLAMPIIAQASGFKSVRRFNALFKAQYRLVPTEIRKVMALSSKTPTNLPALLKVILTYRPPYAWVEQLKYLSTRTLQGVEYVDLENQVYWRSLKVQGRCGWISVSHQPSKSALEVSMSASLVPVIGEVMVLTRRFFDLDASPDEIAKVLATSESPDFSSLMALAPGLRLAGAFNGFELVIRAVLGQLVSVKAAHATASKLTLAIGEPISDYAEVDVCPCLQISRLTPEPAAMLEASQEFLGALGITKMKQGAMKAAAQALIDGELRLDPSADVESTILRLKALPGIGDWTAQYIAMRALAWPDAFPSSDYGVLKVLGGTPAQAVKTAQGWRPWRAYATRYLWHSLSL
jgi:AraC family transcriptional regulator, regulatory protein of adaptative response / DNA-3-methyladenine glycosylase II